MITTLPLGGAGNHIATTATEREEVKQARGNVLARTGILQSIRIKECIHGNGMHIHMSTNC